MHNEIANGENPELTSFVGASAAPSHTPAVKPQITPKLCSDNPAFSTRCTVLAIDSLLDSVLLAALDRLAQYSQQSDAGQQHKKRHQEMAIGGNCLYRFCKTPIHS
jgi:hypothetical protein